MQVQSGQHRSHSSQQETVKYLKRRNAKGQQEREMGAGGGGTPPGAVSDALHLISSWCVCQEIVKIKSNADMK